MGKFTKWIAGGLGWAVLGPIGGILGFALGSLFDDASKTTVNQRANTQGSFAASLLVLLAAVMKADGKVMKSELNYVKQYLMRSFDEESAAEAIHMLRDILKQDIPIQQVSQQIARHVDYASRLQLLQLLYGISKADGEVHSSEIRVIEQIAYYMGISSADMNSIKHMFVEDVDSAYKILEIDRSATNDEVKKAYRKMAVKYHPDKVSYLGEEMQKEANVKFTKVNEAYEAIKKERGMN